MKTLKIVLLLTLILIVEISFSQTANTLPATGDVGVGTTAPSAKLEVVGDTKLGGRVDIDSSVVVRDSVTIEKKLIVDQDVLIKGTSVFVGDGKFKADLKVLGVGRMKDKLIVDSTVVMNSDAKIFGDLKIKSLENLSLTDSRLLSILPNGKVGISNLTVPQDDTYVCNLVTPWAFANNEDPLIMTPTGEITLCPNFTNVGIGTNEPDAKLHVIGNTLIKGKVGVGLVEASDLVNYPLAMAPMLVVKAGGFNQIATKMTNVQNRSIFFVPQLINNGYSQMSKNNDAGIFWTNISNSGLVIAPESTSEIGLRIDSKGRFGFNTQPILQVQYAMNSKSYVGLLVKTWQSGAFGVRVLTTDITDVAFSVAHTPNVFPTVPDVFSVKGDGAVNIRTSATAFTKPFSITDDATNADIFVVQGNGVVGIGGVPDPNTNQYTKLHIENSGDVRITLKDATNPTFFQIEQNGDLVSFNDAGINGGIKQIISMDLSSGHVGIGTIDINDEMLSVEGMIRAREIKVNPSQWYDFVFQEDYSLKTLSEVETYIAKNKHLPNVPSEQEVKEKGINLGEMDGILLQKIEELTLYVIALKKENEKQNRLIEQLSKK